MPLPPMSYIHKHTNTNLCLSAPPCHIYSTHYLHAYLVLAEIKVKLYLFPDSHYFIILRAGVASQKGKAFR